MVATLVRSVLVDVDAVGADQRVARVTLVPAVAVQVIVSRVAVKDN